jgi:hypothetical protein
MKKRLRLVTFWVGVNILGIPKFVDHKFSRSGHFSEVFSN